MATPRKKNTPKRDHSAEDPPFAATRQSPRKKMNLYEGQRPKVTLFELADVAFALGQSMNEENQPAAQEEPPASAVSTSPVVKMDKPPTKRMLQNMEKIPYSMLTQLTQKTTIDLFTEPVPSQNVYRQSYQLRCCLLLDGSCNKIFEGYKNEQRVQKLMYAHQLEHLKAVETKDAFYTTSVQFRNKTESSKKSAAKLKKKPTRSVSDEVDQESQDSTPSSSSGSSKSNSRRRSGRMTPKQEPRESTPEVDKEDKENAEVDTPPKKKKPAKRKKSSDEEESDEVTPVEEQLRSPEHCDHNYSAPPGAPLKKASPASPSDNSSDTVSSFEEEQSQGIRHYDSTGAPMASSEIIFCEEEANMEKLLQSRSRDVDLSEEELRGSSDDDEEAVEQEIIAPPAGRKRRQPALPRNRNEPIPDWEKKMALQCIREQKKKKDEKGDKHVCKICNPRKEFTAGATLMSHYRSHAGLKPFKCPIAGCFAAFTRQHSKNYHLMIHMNKSRFTCPVCYREFRHPSHFSEHKRKHTGETPYVCEDCPGKFKTRNTYKRHLKTRHGKLLTAAGITKLSPEEAEAVKTKPYKKSTSDPPSPVSDLPVPGPSKRASSPPPKPKVQKKKSAAARSSKKQAAVSHNTSSGRSDRSLTATTVSLPPVCTLLPSFSHAADSTATMEGSVGSVNQQVAAPPATQHVMVSVPSGTVHLLPSVQASSHATMTHSLVSQMGTTMVSTGPGLPASHQVVLMPPPVIAGGATPTMSISAPLTGPHAYYTLAFPVNYHMQPQPQVPTPAPPQAGPISTVVNVEDASNYKPVGYMTR